MQISISTYPISPIANLQGASFQGDIFIFLIFNQNQNQNKTLRLTKWPRQSSFCIQNDVSVYKIKKASYVIIL